MGNHVQTDSNPAAKPRNNPGIGGSRWELGYPPVQGCPRFSLLGRNSYWMVGASFPTSLPCEEVRGNEGVPSSYDLSFVLGFAGPLPGMAGASMKGFGGPPLGMAGFGRVCHTGSRLGALRPKGPRGMAGWGSLRPVRDSRAGVLRVGGLARLSIRLSSRGVEEWIAERPEVNVAGKYVWWLLLLFLH